MVMLRVMLEKVAQTYNSVFRKLVITMGPAAVLAK